MNRDVVDVIGYAAATMTTISFLPQLIRVVKLKYDERATKPEQPAGAPR